MAFYSLAVHTLGSTTIGMHLFFSRSGEDEGTFCSNAELICVLSVKDYFNFKLKAF